jgi:hypothetical protein
MQGMKSLTTRHQNTRTNILNHPTKIIQLNQARSLLLVLRPWPPSRDYVSSHRLLASTPPAPVGEPLHQSVSLSPSLPPSSPTLMLAAPCFILDLCCPPPPIEYSLLCPLDLCSPASSSPPSTLSYLVTPPAHPLPTKYIFPWPPEVKKPSPHPTIAGSSWMLAAQSSDSTFMISHFLFRFTVHRILAEMWHQSTVSYCLGFLLLSS